MYLNTHTYYSLRYGTFSAEVLLQLAKKNGYNAIALTDINTTSSCIEFFKHANELGIKPVLGVDFRNGVDQKFILLAKNNSGFKKINTFLSKILHRNIIIPNDAPEFEGVITIYPFRKNKKRALKSNEYIGVTPGDLLYLQLNKIDTRKYVILQTVSFRTKKDFNAHRLLRAIDKNILLSKLPTGEQGSLEDRMIPCKDLLEAYNDYPDIIKNTLDILDICTIKFDCPNAISQNQKTYTNSKEEDIQLLYKLCQEGIVYRYPTMNDEIRERIEKELKTIIELGFVSYFLINWDIVTYARSKTYFYVGRGSGANSVIAYILRITDVDPIELDLYFERFINLYRTSPPDFDIDFSWKDRDDVTRYIFHRFKNVALVATYNTFRDKGVIRELGKVFGLPKEEIDILSKGRKLPTQHHLADLVLKYGQYIHGFPNNLSVHACGILISEKPIMHYTATFMPPKGYPTIQFDMHIAEDLGLHKFDILSQRGLSKIKDTLEIINYNRPNEPFVDVHDMKRFKQDEKIKSMLRKADAIGCFYVESPAMRMLLKKLQVDDYLGLVAASSVIRPGVAQSGMMQEYIKRFRNPEKREEAHPILLDLMPETYGVMVYQEDVIKVAHNFAGLTLGEADKMRRGMSGKFRSRQEFQDVKDIFFNNCKEKGHSHELTSEIWRQTESFAGYAFAKGHSASYAVESYQCLFLKAYYPLEFLVATINNYGGFYSTELYILETAFFGGVIHASCVNNSKLETTIKGTNIYLGFQLLKSFDSQLARNIVSEREENGDYIDFDDFINRVHISLEQITILIRIEAFRYTKKKKRALLWEAHFKMSKTKSLSRSPDLFRVPPKTFDVPKLQNTWQQDAFDQMELLGFPLHNSFSLLLKKNTNALLAEDLPKYQNKKVWIEGYLIHAKRTATSNGQVMFFGTFVDQNGRWLDTVHFPNVARQYPFRGRGIYRIYGKVTLEYDCVLVEAEYMEKMEIIQDPRYTEIRNEEKEKSVVTWNMKKDYGKRTNRLT